MFFFFKRKERVEKKAAQERELNTLHKEIHKSINSIQKNAGKAARIQAKLKLAKDDPTYRLLLAMGVERKMK